MSLHIKRIYEPPSPSDGFRVLVDRLWPRGVSKENADINEWLKDVAPSTELREWFNHEPEKWKSFSEKYSAELKDSPAFGELESIVEKHKNVTLLYAAKDEHYNQAVILSELLQSHKKE
ncbi:MAG: DUF488 domain-containing protein [Chitinophagaceae bacterium]